LPSGHSCALEMTAFFGAGEAGCDYVTHNSVGLEFGQPLVTSSNYNELVNTSMYALMLSQNHNHTSTGAVPANYLAEDVVDFMYAVGRTHAEMEATATPADIKKYVDSIPCAQCRKYLMTMLTEDGKIAKMEGATKPYETKFSSTIPLVPDTINGWISRDVGTNTLTARPWTEEMKKNKNLYPPMFLRNVYAAGYVSYPNPVAPGVNDYDEVVNYNLAAMSGGSLLAPQKWNLNRAAFIKSASECLHMAVPAPKYGKAASSDEVLDLYDMVADVYYGRDPDGTLFRMVNGKKVPVDMSNPFAGNCLGSSKLNCEDNQVAKCLLSGNPKSLAHCLDRLKEEEMFNVAQSEVNGLHPSVLTKVLLTFGFTLKKYSDGLTRPIEFADWETKVLAATVTEDVAKQIKANTKLMAYLKAVVSIVRQNPIVLECNRTARADNSYAARAKIETFVQPIFTSPSGKPLLDQGILLSAPAMPFGLSMPLAAGLQNVMGLGMGRLPLYGMMGGGQSECINADLLKKTFNSLFSRMERNGKVLVDEDKAKVENSIRRVADLERQLNRLMDDIKLFTKLSETRSLSSPVPVDKFRLTDIKSEAEEKRTDARRTLESLTESSSKNIRELSTILNTLVATVIPALNSVVLGLPTGALKLVS